MLCAVLKPKIYYCTRIGSEKWQFSYRDIRRAHNNKSQCFFCAYLLTAQLDYDAFLFSARTFLKKLHLSHEIKRNSQMFVSNFLCARLSRQHRLAKQVLCYSTAGSSASANQQVWKKYVLGAGAAVIAAGLIHDSLNEFQYCGGASRFLRSMKIAAQISIDYTWSLYGVTEDSDEYAKVSTMMCTFIWTMDWYLYF